MADFVTPRDLAHEFGVPQKEIRDYLRQEYGLLSTRNETRWQLDASQAAAVRKYFRVRL
jgi:DNA-binding GntR family transcriptional regulator